MFPYIFLTVCHHPTLGFCHRSCCSGFGICLQSKGMLSTGMYVLKGGLSVSSEIEQTHFESKHFLLPDFTLATALKMKG